MDPTQLRLESFHRNHFLFADHYLNHVVRSRDAWRRTDVAPVVERLAGIWDGYTPRGDSEAQTEADFIRPVLEALGHHTLVQVPLETPQGTRRPDYVLFADADAATAVKGRTVAEDDLGDALAVADAKAWELPLDKQLPPGVDIADYEVSRNPAVQIDFYIRHTGLPWGILTNGRHWRLYHAETSKRLEVYYEVDLPALLDMATADYATDEQRDALKYFWLFFRREAFAGDPSWLDTVLEESRAYAQGVSDHLKSQVYEALGVLAQGFLDYPSNGLEPTPETLKQIHDSSLIVLYRLLFTLYAEDRGLLPLRDPDDDTYREVYSLYRLKREIARDLRLARPAVASVANLWSDLRNLWAIINHGNAELGVDPFNGGLFDAERHPFLERNQVGDLHLRRAVDLVTRAADPQTGEREFVDYRDLEIRHLGSIYEGLLEYQLRHADEPLSVTKSKGKEVYEPAEDADAADVAAGDVYLITDKGERKATGSYYTPDYIVQYIVENTVGPVLEEVREAHAGDDAALEQAVLEVNVLDPAMGSGHFLVAATEYIAEFLTDLSLQTTRDLRELGEAGGEKQYWMRRVAQACIYGVDLNPLAVELAKLSLWLATAAKGKPLSFLDHHLRCGNSLIGARVADLLPDAPEQTAHHRRKERTATEAGQLTMLDEPAFREQVQHVVGLMDGIEAIEGETLDQVHEAERRYEDEFREATRPLRRAADVVTARHFGLEIDDEVQTALVEHLLEGGGFELPQWADVVAEAEEIARERRFFHWELEYPEVFFASDGRLGEESGFDAVVGNPPYDEVSEYYSANTEHETQYFSEIGEYRCAATGRINLYRLFLLRTHAVARTNALMSYIVPLTILSDRFSLGTRKRLFEWFSFLRVEAFPQKDDPHRRVFVDAKQSTCILVLRHGREPSDRVTTRTHPGRLLSADASTYVADQDSLFELTPGQHAIPLVSQQEWEVLDRRLHPRHGQLLDSYAAIYSGEISDNAPNKKYLSNEPVGPLVLRGAHINRYNLLDEPSQGTPRYLREDRWLCDKGDTTRGRHPRSARIAFQKGAAIDNWRRLIATVIPEDHYCFDTIGYLPWPEAESPYCILALLNSKLWDFRFSATSTTNHVNAYELEIILVPDTAVRGSLASELRAGAQQMIELHEQRQRLEAALDPFKYIDRGVAFVKLPEALADAVKYGELMREPVDLGAVHHDIDGMRLVPDGEQWALQVELKLRDPDDDWASWQYDEGGHYIARRWVTAYRLPLEEAKARYYQYALEARDEFEHTKGFPGGKTRTTLKKLQLTRVPAFDPEADLTPLVELSTELADVRQRIERTDRLIDLVVYRLYGLTEDEIAIVEGRSAEEPA